MKGLLKGLRYISHMFDHEKEPEMKIGMPTDVKHVAHIGWDGPSAVNTAPSWMNEFKNPAGFQSTPLAHGGEVREDPAKWASQDSRRMSRKSSRGQSSSTRDRPELPKSSKSTTTSAINGLGGSSKKEKTDKAKQSKKSRKPKDSNQETESTSKDPKKSSRRKKMKDSSEGSSRRYRNVQDLDTVSESGSQFSYCSDFVEREGT